MDIASISSNAPTAVVPTQAPQPPPEQRALIQAVRAINAAQFFGANNELTFVLDRGLRRPVVRIVNRETREVVQQIPPEYVLRMAEELNRG